MALAESVIDASSGIDLEVDVRPAAGVARRDDAGEADLALGVGDLDAAEVVLVLHALGVHRVPAGAVAVPGVDGDPGERRVVLGHVHDGELELERHTLGRRGRGAERGADVAADDARLLEHVRSVGSVAGVGTGGLVGDLGHPAGTARRTRRRSTPRRLRRRPGRTSPRRARTPSASGGGRAAYGRRSRGPGRRPRRPGAAGDGPGTRVRAGWDRAEAGSRGRSPFTVAGRLLPILPGRTVPHPAPLCDPAVCFRCRSDSEPSVYGGLLEWGG